jgi:hypothetical protein
MITKDQNHHSPEKQSQEIKLQVQQTCCHYHSLWIIKKTLKNIELDWMTLILTLNTLYKEKCKEFHQT